MMLMSIIFPVYAQGETYRVYDNRSDFKEEFATYREAYSFYEDNLEEYENLILANEEKILQMEYGVVRFNTDEACSMVVDYYSIDKKSEDFHNGCYGVDAAYLYSDEESEKVYFMLSGDKGYTSIDNVTLIPFEDLKTRISSFSINDGKLMHNIMAQLDYDFYSYSFAIDNRPEYLTDNKTYYSYDTHYFYEDFYQMIDDYRQEEYVSALNETPYYNYYQYLPHRSLSTYNSEELEDYFYNTLGVDGKLIRYNDLNGDQAADEVNRSQLYGEINNFFVYQNMYGCNALMLLSSAINESAYGRSLMSYRSNNLYSSAAYETEEEKEFDRYDTIDDSIYSHAKYFISSRFSNHQRSDYHGTFYGNKLSGINVNYSMDPYYGEKSAAAYFDLDLKLALKDYNHYALGIIKDEDRITFYKDPEMENRMFRLEDITELSFVILENNEDSYKISIDNSRNDEYLYDFSNSVAYVAKDVFAYILNEDKIADYKLKEKTYDFAGGNFHDYGKLTIKVLPNDTSLIIPSLSGYEFVRYEDNTAQYRKISSLMLSGSFDTTELYSEPDLSKLRMKVFYEDQKNNSIEINTDMLSPYDNSIDEEENIDLSYCGMSVQSKLVFSKQLNDLRNTITQAIEGNDYETIKNNLGKISYPFSFAQIRNIDYALMTNRNRNYVIDDKTERYNVSVSGLDLSLPDKNVFSFVEDTYYVILDKIASKDEDKIFAVAKGYGFEKVEGLNISFRFNFENIKLMGPAIVQIDIKDKKNNLVYTVYHLDSDGNVIKCRTTQSENYIQFMISEAGSYLVLSLPSVNEFDIKDNTEDLSYENMGFDNHKINFELMIVLVLTLCGLIGVTLYYIVYRERKKVWKDYRRSLQTAGSVQEEKPKN